MSEKSEGPEAGAPGADPIALAGAVSRASPAVDAELVAYLRDQRSHMHETLKQIHLDIFEKWLGVCLRLATLIVGLAAAAGVALMVWQARNSAGLIVEPFAVPPDLASRGLSGQVVASQLLDKLTVMQNVTRSYRAPKTFANNWGDDVKVEIPETGISIGELRRFLREWLGHDTHISGEVWRTETGIAISARAGGDSGKVFAGPQSDFDILMQKAAEHVFSRTQPFRYGNYLRPLGRFQESRASYLSQINAESKQEQGWAWYGIGVLDAVWLGKTKQGLWAYRKAVAAYPELTIGWSGIGAAEAQQGHFEAALQARQRLEELISRDGMADIAPRSVAYVRAQWVHSVPLLSGDYTEAMRRGRMGAAMPDQQGFQITFLDTVVRALVGRHEVSAAQSALVDVPPTAPDGAQIGNKITDIRIKAAREDWRDVAEAEAAVERWVPGRTGIDVPLALGVTLRPWAALAKAKLGDVVGARSLIETTPADCYDCVRVRAAIAEMGKQPDVADTWFALAVHDGPSIPFAYHNWGMALLERGKPDDAIEKFKLANKKGPHFADPLEGWGEALMAKKQSHLALAKFKEAEKHAPNWGRLHLKWGEALVYAGNKREAKGHFTRAAQLDLTPSEKAELTGMN
jgi:tetratricopeptide (TPR) repeat protein